MSKTFSFEPYIRQTFPPNEMIRRSREYYQWMDTRRTVRDFTDRPVPKEVIENLIMTASTAPSGAHKQPWSFYAISNPDMKRQIREAAEQEEYKNYNGRMSEEWLKDLEYLGTDWRKPFLEIAPWLIVVFKRIYEPEPDGHKHTNYYVSESVGLACGFLLAAIHEAGLVALTHTPSPMNFLCKLLNRPQHERPFLVIPVGYPAEEVHVPSLRRKSLGDVATFYV